MLRGLIYLLCSILLISFLRSVIGIILKGFGELFAPAEVQQSRPNTAGVPVGGELKKDPVCGTYISTATSIKKTSGDHILHFCSTSCRDKYTG
jgi:YHS domain-containing protein